MSSGSAPEYASAQPFGDNPNLKMSSNTQIVIENTSDDITISKCEQEPVEGVTPKTNINAPPLKAQVLPLVYIQNNPKVPFASINATNKSSNNNFVFSPISSNPNFVNKPSTSLSSISINSNQNLIFAQGRGRSIVLPKTPITIVPPGAKMAGTYVTIKQVTKPTDGINPVQFDHLSSGKGSESLVVSQSGFNQTGTQPQKLVITPMPNVQTNRPPATATTNCVQSKFTILPMPLSQNTQNDSLPTPPQKIYNFQISDGKLKYSNFSGPLTIMCENKNSESHTEQSEKKEEKDILDPNSENNLICKDKCNDPVSEKLDISNKSYELSIAEESLSSQSDEKIISSVDNSSSSNENAQINSSTLNRQPVKFSHGVSILKKNFASSLFQELKKKDDILTTNNNTKLQSDTDLTIIKPSNGMEEKIVVTVPSISTQKPERERSRRKAQFCYRKDFDETTDISFPDSDCGEIKTEIKKEVHEEIKGEIKDENKEAMKAEDIGADQESQPAIIDPKSILNLNGSDSDAVKLLTWEDGIGSLPGSNLKFILNEFGIVEYLSEDDYQKILNKRLKKAKEKVDMEREVRCQACGCYGIRSDFISADFCSIDCQETQNYNRKRSPDIVVPRKGYKRKFDKCRSDSDIKSQANENSGDEENSSDTVQDKFAYPWACKKKGFSWSKYLAHVNAKAAPVKLFKDPFPYTRNSFKSGMKLEGVDPQHPSYFCVLTVIDVVGYRIRLHFDGYSDSYDFWTNADSMNIFPMGWCEKYGHILRPPPGYTEDNFNWVQYLRVTKSTAAPKHLFANRAGQAICPNGFRIGMKLEAVDKKDSSLICVATVRDMMDNRILVHFDGWDDIYDYWADPTSPYIHPVGWCDQYGHNLTAPSDYPTPEVFTWEKYLKETKSVAAPVRAFKQRPACGFKRGMRLECVDKRVPHLIRVATVDDVKEHQIRIHFDGWPDRYSYWVDDDSPDIHPVGWCQKTGHPMEPPLTPDDVYDFLECPTVGCRGQGHIKGLKYTTHSSQKFCPYAEGNIDIERDLPDRLLSPENSPEAKIPVSREPKDYRLKPRIGRPPKWLKELEASQKDSTEPSEKRPRRRNAKSKRDVEKDDLKDTSNHFLEDVQDKAQKLIEESRLIPAEKESWEKHSAFLNDYISSFENPLSWSKNDVIDFIASIPGCDYNLNFIKDNEIDGESFLQLNQSDIVQLLHFKVGPAVKLYSSIILLREQYSTKKK